MRVRLGSAETPWRQVYNHRVRLITDATIMRSVCLAASEDVDIVQLFAYDGQRTFHGQWLALDDQVLCRRIWDSKSMKGKGVLGDRMARRLHKRIAHISLRHEIKDVLVRNELAKLGGDDLTEIEVLIADELGMEGLKREPWRVIVDLVTFTKPGLAGEKAGIVPSTILILMDTGVPSTLQEHPDAMVAFPEQREYLDVYIPGEFVPSADRSTFLQECNVKVISVLTEKFS